MKNIKIINISPATTSAKYKFINPNSCTNLCLKKQTINSCNFTKSSENRITKFTELQLINNLAKFDWPGLVFLQKRGSSHANPNPNIISYKFPGAKTKSNISSSVALTRKLQTDSLLALQLPQKINYHPKAGNKSVTNLNRFIINNVYKLLFMFFKSMYCLISKPVFITNQDKIKIQLFYFVCTSLASAKRKFISAYYDNQNNVENTSGDLAILPQHMNSITERKDKLALSRKLAFVASQEKGNSLIKVYPKKFKIICGILSKFFNKTVELELIRIHKPYFDSTILVNYLALIINKKNIANSIKKLYNRNIIQSSAANFSCNYLWAADDNLNNMENNFMTAAGNSTVNQKAIDLVHDWLGLSYQDEIAPSKAYLAGLKIKINGRLMREAIVPRITTKKFEKGFTANGKVNYSDVARFTSKNRKGAFSITIKSGQKF